jgi:dihydrofolate reductase
MRLALIAAIARNGVIGRGGTLPWHLPEDLKRFKRLTTGSAILMGRKTYESIGRPLPNRRNVVLSSHAIPGVECYPTLESALAALGSADRIFVIGGGTLYAQLLERADELYLTLLDGDVEGDTTFPPYAHLIGSRFRETARETHDGFTFVDFVRL